MQCDTNGVFEDFIDCKNLEVNDVIFSFVTLKVMILFLMTESLLFIYDYCI